MGVILDSFRPKKIYTDSYWYFKVSTCMCQIFQNRFMLLITDFTLTHSWESLINLIYQHISPFPYLCQHLCSLFNLSRQVLFYDENEVNKTDCLFKIFAWKQSPWLLRIWLLHDWGFDLSTKRETTNYLLMNKSGVSCGSKQIRKWSSVTNATCESSP